MSSTQRPWWLIINKPAGLITTVRDDSVVGRRIFVIKGEPVVQGLTWLTCGPLAALAAIVALTGLAIIWEVQSQGGMVRVLFVAAFLGFPALVWGATVAAVNRLSRRHVQAIREAESQRCTIALNQQTGTLTFTRQPDNQKISVAYQQIQRVHVTPAIGAQDVTKVYLTLETDEGRLVLLDERLGTHNQKADLALEIESTLQKYLAKQNPPAAM